MGLLGGEVESSPVVYFKGDICMCTGVRDVDVGDSPIAAPPKTAYLGVTLEVWERDDQEGVQDEQCEGESCRGFG